MLEHLGGIGRSAQRRDRAGGATLGDERRGQCAQRRHEALGQDEHAGALRNPFAVRGEDARQGPGGDRQADEIRVGQPELGGAHHAHRLGQLDARQVGIVPARGGDDRRLLPRPGSELDLEAGTSQQHRQARAPRPGADDRDAADRRHAAEPLPLKHDHRPDPLGDRAGERRRGARHRGELQRAAGAEPHLARPDAPPPADVLGADDRDRDDRRPGLEREPSDAAPRLAERARPGPRPLGEHQHDLPAREDDLGRLDRVMVAPTPIHREGPERAQHPAHDPVAGEQLLLGHVVHGPPGHRPDDERVDEAPMVGRQDHRTLGRDVLAPDPLHPQINEKERRQDQPDDEQHEAIYAALPCAPVQLLLIHRTLPYPRWRRPLQFRHP